jgi:hypothetical protein
MSEDFSSALIPVVIALFIIWLIYRIKFQIKTMIKNEIFNHFPLIKDSIATLDFRLNYIKNQLESCEKKLKEIEAKLTK